MTQSVATIDEKGRLVLPRDSRRKAGIKSRSKLLVEVRGPGIIELRDFEHLSKRVQTVAAKKLTGWKEEEHKEELLLSKLSKESKYASNY
ncbi:MAG: AbrB/MazE/SpoVT family DNA-binding domain-containing protein [Nitrososphaerales archaeon]